MEGTPYLHRMAKQVQQDQVTRAARRAVLIDGIPVVTLGGIALALGSNPDQSTAQKAWWIATTTVFTLAMAWVLLRAFRRADEYLRRIQLESMAIAFAAVLVGLQVATLLDAAGIIQLHQLAQLILLGGVAIWLLIAGPAYPLAQLTAHHEEPTARTACSSPVEPGRPRRPVPSLPAGHQRHRNRAVRPQPALGVHHRRRLWPDHRGNLPS
jgi:hypothetical protein